MLFFFEAAKIAQKYELPNNFVNILEKQNIKL